MATNECLAETFATLKSILQKHGGRMQVVTDQPGDFALASRSMRDPSGRPLFAAGVKIRKNYVSYHLMPVYMNPALLKDVPPALRRRMHGKSCFNFTAIDRDDARALAAITRKGLAGFKNLELPWS